MAKGSISFRVVSIDIISKSLYLKPDDFEGKDYNFETAVELAVAPESNWVLGFFSVTLKEANKDPKLAAFTIACIFEILNFAEHIPKDADGKYDIPKDLELFLKSTTISTSRGVLYSELKGTYLHYAILPIVDVSTMGQSPARKIFDDGKFIDT